MTKKIRVSFLFCKQIFRLNLIEKAYDMSEWTLITESETTKQFFRSKLWSLKNVRKI